MTNKSALPLRRLINLYILAKNEVKKIAIDNDICWSLSIPDSSSEDNSSCSSNFDIDGDHNDPFIAAHPDPKNIDELVFFYRAKVKALEEELESQHKKINNFILKLAEIKGITDYLWNNKTDYTGSDKIIIDHINKFIGKKVNEEKAKKVADLLEKYYKKMINEGIDDKEAKRRIFNSCKSRKTKNNIGELTLVGMIKEVLDREDGQPNPDRKTLSKYWKTYYPLSFKIAENPKPPKPE